MGLSDMVRNAVEQHEDEIKAGIEKAGDFVDEKTDGAYAGTVDQAQEFLESRLTSATEAPSA